MERRAEMLEIIARQSAAVGWSDAALLAGIAWKETRFDPTLKGDGGDSVGLFQIQPATAELALSRPVSEDELLEPGFNARVAAILAGQIADAARRRADVSGDTLRRVVAHAHNAGRGYVLSALAALGGAPSWAAIVDRMKTHRIPIAGREGTWEPADSSYAYVDSVLSMADTFGMPADAPPGAPRAGGRGWIVPVAIGAGLLAVLAVGWIAGRKGD